MAAEDIRTGKRSITAIAPIVGGGGGMPHGDGTDGSGADAAYLKNSPIEITEAEAPIRILRYGMMPDTGGPGAHRGGMAQILEFTTDAPDAFVTARNRDRSVFQPWGILGGKPGAAGSFTMNPGSNREQNLLNTDALRLPAGDILRFVSPGGGGRGDPMTRDPQAVLRDIRAGRVSLQAAERDYGVVIVGGVVDEAATAGLRATQPASSGFGAGEARLAHERRWDAQAYATMLAALGTLPVSWRAPVKKLLFAAVREAHPDRPAAEVIAETFQSYLTRTGRSKAAE
jgi:N-methylhydantoinase B